MSWLTAVTALVLIVAALAGWRAGLIKRVLELLGLCVAVLLATRYGNDVGLAVESATDMPRTAAVVAGWLVVVGVGFLVAKLLAWAVSRAVNATILGWVDRSGGALFGLGVGALIASVLLVLGAAVPGNDRLRAMVEEEPLPHLVHGVAPTLWRLVNGEDQELERRLREGFDAAGRLGRDAASAARLGGGD